MALDLQALAAKISTWSGDAVTIAGAASRLYAAYLRLEPTAKASIEADVQALTAAWQAVDTALGDYTQANSLSKIAAIVTIGDVLAKTAPIVARIFRDAQALFGSDWPVVQPDIETIITTLKGSKI